MRGCANIGESAKEHIGYFTRQLPVCNYFAAAEFAQVLSFESQLHKSTSSMRVWRCYRFNAFLWLRKFYMNSD